MTATKPVSGSPVDGYWIATLASMSTSAASTTTCAQLFIGRPAPPLGEQ